ncbi:MAG: pseudouridine synthase [Gemmatimonadaceae bacterium]
MAESMRIQRVLARAGVASRRRADAMVAAGRVAVNGEPARTGQSVNPARDRITVDGQSVRMPGRVVWIALNKPPGVLTTRSDRFVRPTVFDLIAQSAPLAPGLTYVGRLDYMTEGLLLLTTDGRAAHRLTHPSSEVERRYVATVRGPARRAVRLARAGVELDDGPVNPRSVDARPLDRGRWAFEVTIAEGRTREIRRLCEALGLEVEGLVRTAFGPVSLGSLAPGETRALTRAERAAIAALVRRPARPRTTPTTG